MKKEDEDKIKNLVPPKEYKGNNVNLCFLHYKYTNYSNKQLI